MKWVDFFIHLFKLFEENKYQPYAKALCHMMLPCAREWRKHFDYKHDNDNLYTNGDLI